MATSLRVREVGASKHETSEYVTQDLYLPGIDDQGRKVLAYLRRELHIVDNLRVKMLIKNDIIRPEGIVIDIANKKARINSCKTTVDITARPRGEFVRKKIYARLAVFVPPYSEMILFIREVNLS